jgi:carboxymethylenebutenolidase
VDAIDAGADTVRRRMCVPFDSRPPIPPLAGAAVSHELIELEAADGNRLAAFSARPEAPTDVGVVVLPDVRGLFAFYEELALRLAERGIAAVAIDYFGRTAGASERAEDFEYMDHVMQTTQPGVQADVGAAVEHLRSNGVRKVCTVGFCFGGRHSWLATASHDLAGAIGFYGNPGPGRDGTPGPIERVGELRGPILGLMGGADQAIPADVVERFDHALADAGVEHEIVTYEGAPHSFFDRRQEQYADASADAWERVLGFVAGH